MCDLGRLIGLKIELKIDGRTKVLQHRAIRDMLLCDYSALLYANLFDTSRISSWEHGDVSIAIAKFSGAGF